ncbi:hypothetical protein N7452_005807 [Penicillium brevicompactum]|uniref:Uncharacterized protein n=1 Tax=Penicillium brevicompactum TaxID=5074 RepID=A0A9W9UG15_PENBR|nr:hypothetical protein N7452_005807 [Penicillium brevicompactum]
MSFASIGQPEASKDWLSKTADIEPDLYAYLVLARQPKDLFKTTGRFFKTRVPIVPTSPIPGLLSSYGSSVKSAPNVQDIDFNQKITITDRTIINIRQNASFVKQSIQPLKENVERQMKFVEKMHIQLWIRSPAVQGTLGRAIDRYTKFLGLFKAHPGTLLVPTLDIDLVWHTHQCSAKEYQRKMIDLTGRFVDHNDKIGKPVLSGGLDTTVNLFKIRFGESYMRCLCWDCEASMSALADVENTVNDDDIDTLVQKVQDDLEYFRLVELTRRNGGTLPARE